MGGSQVPAGGAVTGHPHLHHMLAVHKQAMIISTLEGPQGLHTEGVWLEGNYVMW